ncbi:glycosyltransferase family 4 protein [Candidatus Marinimicrobia bacterium]|nr:glycosyltransferase family 4 protein [Candidatus Neomarinimicrobiota bacterium]
MKILLVTQYFFPENLRSNDLADSLSKRGHDVTVLTGLPNYPGGDFFEGFSFFKFKKESYYKTVKVIRCRMIPRKNGSQLFLILNYLSFAIFASLKVLFLKEKKFDASFVFAVSPITAAIPAIILKFIEKTPMVIWVQDLWPDSVVESGKFNSRIGFSILEKITKYIYNKSDRILVSSKGMVKSIKNRGVNIKKIFFLPQWAEDIFENWIVKEKYGISMPDGFNIVFAGNIGVAQDISSIIKASELLKEKKNINFIFIGKGSEYSWLKKQILKKRLSDTVHILGSYPLEDMPYFFEKSDAMLVTLKKSKIWSITIPAKIQTYLLTGKPILTMLDGEGSELIDNAKAGLTAESGDYRTLVKNILKIESYSREKRNEMGKNGAFFYKQKFLKKKSLSKLETILENIV